MDDIYDLTSILKGDDLKPVSDLEMIRTLSNLEYESAEKVKSEYPKILKNYCYFIRPYFKSLSLSPIEEKLTREELALAMIQSFVFFTANKSKGVSSLIWSIRYFLSLV